MTKIKRLAVIAAMCIAALFAGKARADDISRGIRGPTNWQADSRISYSENDLDIKTTTENLILKYWDGDEVGVFGFLNLPYKTIATPAGTSSGLGDISLGLGPRGRLGNFQFLSYAGFALPTGNDREKIPFGNGRLDAKIGFAGTYLAGDKKYELDGIVERNFTGENNSGINPPDETYLGVLAGMAITEKIRFAGGPTGLMRDNGDFNLNLRTVLRYTPSSQFHLELVLDNGIKEQNVPKSNGFGIYFRRNF